MASTVIFALGLVKLVQIFCHCLTRLTFFLVLAAFGLVDDMAVPEGGWLLQTAAGSVLGRILIAIAKKQGIKTINVIRRSEQKQELLDLGWGLVLPPFKSICPCMHCAGRFCATT